MERGVLLFVGGVMVVMALFIPTSVLEDNKLSGKIRKGANCPIFKDPQAYVGSFNCKRKKNLKIPTYVCDLNCPPFMQAQPMNGTIMFQCRQGNWVASHEHVHCTAKSVPLVEQQSAPPRLLNKLLHRSLNDNYAYLAMAYFFDRSDVQLPGFHKYFLNLWRSSIDIATGIMAYLNKRGGWIDLHSLPRPSFTEKLHLSLENNRVGLEAMKEAVAMEKDAQELTLEVLEKIERDPHLKHTLEEQHLGYRVKKIKELVDYITRLRAFEQSDEGDYELGQYELDIALQEA